MLFRSPPRRRPLPCPLSFFSRTGTLARSPPSAGRHTEPSIPAARGQADDVIGSADLASVSPPTLACWNAAGRANRTRHPRLRPPWSCTAASRSALLRPRRAHIHVSGELLRLVRLSSPHLSLSVPPPPYTAAAAPPWSPPAMLRRPNGRSRRSLCSSPLPLAVRATSRVQFRAQSTD